jgi:hypothetical protein
MSPGTTNRGSLILKSMNRFIGQKVLAKVGPPSINMLRNCRVSAVIDATHFTVNVFNREHNYWYADHLDVTEADIAATISGDGW